MADVTVAEFEEIFESVKNWGRWGEGRQYRCRSSCGGSVVLVDEATELVAAANLTDCAASPHH